MDGRAPSAEGAAEVALHAGARDSSAWPCQVSGCAAASAREAIDSEKNVHATAGAQAGQSWPKEPSH